MTKNPIQQRKVINFRDAPFETYSLQGESQDDLSWHNISWSEVDGAGFFLIKFDPGGVSIPHAHCGYEEFIILEGELEDHDGFVYHQGDCVSLSSGSKHFSTSKSGAIIGVFVRGGFEALPDSAEL